jgi:hypothetical protein
VAKKEVLDLLKMQENSIFFKISTTFWTYIFANIQSRIEDLVGPVRDGDTPII